MMERNIRAIEMSLKDLISDMTHRNSINLYVRDIQNPKELIIEFEEKILFLIQTNARNLR